MNFTYKLYKLNLILTKNNSVAKKIKKIFLVSLNDIIQGALNFVRPIIDTSGSMQSDLMISRKLQSETIRGRDAEILGSPKYSSTLDDMPICRSNSRICKFITCSAHNFQNDESLSNLNLAAQMLADTRLRKMIASNPSILLTVCQEHGLSSVQCKLFANAFQLINRFISTIEPLEVDDQKLHHSLITDEPYYNDSDAPPIPIQPGLHQNIGSQTWSTNEKTINNSELISQKKSFREKGNLPEISMHSHSIENLINPLSAFSNLNIATSATTTTVTPITTLATLPTFPALIFTFPTFATVTPMLSPHVSSFKSPIINMLTKEMEMLMTNFDKKLSLPNAIPSPLSLIIHSEQFKPINWMESVRNKRSNDYYDNIEEQNDEPKNMGTSLYDKISDNNQRMIKFHKQTIGQKGLVDCIKFLKDN
ncbi:unnamed protein product [Brugia timori]|uniref:Uncharacterized protein n=1 Tax=Brugia timori TaxID=42155 RepID=A0A0R3QNC1_9BILA|nr:unnamed protein product [Brugia timori]